MNNKRAEKLAFIVLSGVALILIPGLGYSEIPQQINYQGYLTDAAGSPVNGNVEMVFSIYTTASGVGALWTETQIVTLTKGIFNVILGDHISNPLNLPFDSPYYLGIKVGSDQEMLPRQVLTSVGYAYRANVTNSVVGTGTFSTPIVSTVATGTAPLQVASTTRTPNLNADMVDGNHATDFAPAGHGHDDRYYTKTEVNNLVNGLETRIAALEAKLNGLTRVNDDFVITGANLFIQSGSGSTTGTVNGKGNLIIGYNELRGSGSNRNGSHNLIVGNQHNYSSYGGIVVGHYNTISERFASVIGGSYNAASGYFSMVTGGASNIASGDYSLVAGGGTDIPSNGNIAFGHYTAILGGISNKAGDPALTDHFIGQFSTVSGGSGNTASGYSSSVSGGNTRSVTGDYDWRAGDLFQDQ